MEKQKNTQMFVIAILAVAVLTMSVGFAVFTQTLDINGNVTVASSKWSIAFDTSSYVESDGSVAVSNKTLDGTSMTYNVTLSKPKDFYEFTVKVKNTGTFDANLTGITMSALGVAEAKYLKYEIYYNDTKYTTTTTEGLSIALANTTGEATVKVRVEYIQPDDYNDLPSDAVTVPLTASLTYKQAQ